MRFLKIILIIIPVLTVAAWLGIQRYTSDSGSLPPLHTVTVERGDVSQRVIAHGSLQPVEKVTVGSQVSGIVDELFVDFNSLVKKGQIIAQIDPSAFAAEVNSAEAELESAEAGLELARHQWKRVQELRENRFIAPSEVDQANSNLKQAEAQVSVRRHALDRAQLELNRSTIYSPTDGIVISRNVDVGQTVAASLSAPDLFEIATDLSKMHIHANVSEADIGLVNDQQQVRFKVDGYRDREFEGEVIQVRNAPIIEDNVVHYETIITVNNEENLLKPGMTAEVSIITNERHDVLRLRNTALRARLPENLQPPDPVEEVEDDSNARVYLFHDDEIVSTSVHTGLNDGVYTEILSGIEEGDVLVVGLSLRSQGDNDRGNIIGGSQAQY
ncbi:MAG: efflux RND transporter periplasmic adaptor subunit [Balneolales bacterium]